MNYIKIKYIIEIMVIYGIIIIKATNDGVRYVQDKDYLTVKDVAEMLDTEAYVLRFYEKELKLEIKRNSKGHRVYTLEDVDIFRKIQEMREKGLQLKAIENIMHDSNEEIKDTYEQLSSISLAPMAPTKVVETTQLAEVDITDMEDEKVKQFSYLMKEMMKQALVECHEQSKEELKEEIKQEVSTAVEEKVMEIQEAQDAKNEEYYRKLDETMREVQRMRKELSEVKEDAPKKEKASLFSRLFKGKNENESVHI
ncbi:MAG: MerR family transcriptional regulator [Cellulosilyticum sp.]|nr:MerR family transcriptional regulator [Cellulosilyticum sp.]